MNFPEWSDLGGISQSTRYSWDQEINLRAKFRKYFDGSVFNETIPNTAGSDDKDIELYPVGINLVRMLCIAQADSLFGEWGDEIVSFEPIQNLEVTDNHKNASLIMRDILIGSSAESLLWELALDANIYGGAAMKVSAEKSLVSKVKWRRIPLDTFFPIYDPQEIDNLLEVYIVSEITREQARIKYGITSDKDTAVCVEHWTPMTYEYTVDGKRIGAYSGINPWGFVPFEYLPRMRTTHWWGDSLTEEVMRVQDELNMRVADLGEAINFNAHPIKYGYNLPKKFNVKNYPVDPGMFWDLGRVIGSSPEPKVDVLEAKNPIPDGTFDYIQFVYDYGRVSTSSPPVAFGEDSSGSQRSGATLEIRMLSLIRAVRRQRAYVTSFLNRAARKSALILQQKDFEDISKRALNAIIAGEMAPKYSPILPRDQAKLVDETIKRLTSMPPTLSLESAVKKLGEGTSEVERIKEMLADDALYERDTKGSVPGMNSGVGDEPRS